MNNEPKFIVDEMLGKLAKWLRAMGYDTVYYKDGSDSGLVQRALEEDRIILTKDTRLVERKLARKSFLIKSDTTWDQLKEVIEEFGLDTISKLFTRCIICNEKLLSASKDDVRGNVPIYTYLTHNEFSLCPNCRRIYWSGTHKDNMLNLISNLISYNS